MFFAQHGYSQLVFREQVEFSTSIRRVVQVFRRVRYVEYAQGVVSYPEHDACAEMLLSRRGDELLNLCCMFLYTPGHYRVLKSQV